MRSKVRGNPELERQLGLEGASFGPTESVSWGREPGDRVGDRTASTNLRRLYPHQKDLRFAKLTVMGTEAALQVSGEARILRCIADRAEGWLAMAGREFESYLSTDPLNAAVVDIAARTTGAISLWLRSGKGLLLEFDEDGFTYTPVETAAAAPFRNLGFPDVLSDAHELGDSWLEGELRRMLAEPTLWNRVAALGSFVRLRRYPFRQSAGRGGGGPSVRNETVVSAYRWARTLNHYSLVELDDRLRDACDRLEVGIDSWVGASTKSDWPGTVVELCLLREETEAVFQVLDGRGPLLLWQRLMSLDGRAAPLAAGLPQESSSDNERLRRIAEADPWAWWAKVVRWP